MAVSGLQGKCNVVVLPKAWCHHSRFNEVLFECQSLVRLPSSPSVPCRATSTHGSKSGKLWISVRGRGIDTTRVHPNLRAK